jgi:hypothetical protein
MLVLLVVLLINMATHFDVLEYLKPFKRTLCNMTIKKKFFGQVVLVSSYEKKFIEN